MNHGPSSGLFAFKNLTRGPIGRSSLVLRFSEEVTELHQHQLLDAINAWMVAQKMIAENGGVPPTREQIDARMRMLSKPKEDTSVT